MEKKVGVTIASAISLLLLVVVMMLIPRGPTELGYQPIPEPESPYTHLDLKEIIQVFAKQELPENAVDVVLKEVAPHIKTFTGEKYAKFEPKLSWVARSYPTKLTFVFRSFGYVDGVTDDYKFYIDFRDDEAEITSVGISWGGVPEKYRSMAERIALENSEVQEVRKTSPYLVYFSWDPEKYAHVSLSFDSVAPGQASEPERPMAKVEVDLENQKVVSISKFWWPQ
jgi:hypothetical protein